MTAASEAAVRIRGLRIAFPRASGELTEVVRGVDLDLRRGEILGLVGESGSGKSMLALSMLGLVPAPGGVIDGQILLPRSGEAATSEDQLRDLVTLQDPAQWRQIRGGEIGMIFQDPMSSLNPVRQVGAVLVESLRRHSRIGRAEARRRAVNALAEVGIPAPEARVRAYPHELSGGLRQRVMIALALINRPSVILADEPTTALDATIQAQVLELLRRRVRHSALMLITHDIGAAAEVCDRLAVMYAGRIVETGPTAAVIGEPSHPYTVGLVAAMPRFDPQRRRLHAIAGQPPNPTDLSEGCAFAPRCPRVHDPCRQDPMLAPVAGRQVACWAVTAPADQAKARL